VLRTHSESAGWPYCLIPNRGIVRRKSIMEIGPRTNALFSVDVLRQFSARTVKENEIDLANKQQWIMKQLRCINGAARNILVATSTVAINRGTTHKLLKLKQRNLPPEQPRSNAYVVCTGLLRCGLCRI
jgi:hypothetical protein